MALRGAAWRGAVPSGAVAHVMARNCMTSPIFGIAYFGHRCCFCCYNAVTNRSYFKRALADIDARQLAARLKEDAEQPGARPLGYIRDLDVYRRSGIDGLHRHVNVNAHAHVRVACMHVCVCADRCCACARLCAGVGVVRARARGCTLRW